MAEEKVVFFKDPPAFRRWLARSHRTSSAQWVGFYKRQSGKPSITWPESVDQALCFGWIDGVRMSIDAERYKIRFSPRKPRSIWSLKNVKRMAELEALGLVEEAGRKAFAARDEARSGIYSFERKEQAAFSAAMLQRFQAAKEAWAYFQAKAPWYQRSATHWVVSAKQEATQLRRLDQLITDSAAGRDIAVLKRRPGKG